MPSPSRGDTDQQPVPYKQVGSSATEYRVSSSVTPTEYDCRNTGQYRVARSGLQEPHCGFCVVRCLAEDRQRLSTLFLSTVRWRIAASWTFGRMALRGSYYYYVCILCMDRHLKDKVCTPPRALCCLFRRALNASWRHRSHARHIASPISTGMFDLAPISISCHT